MITIQQWRISIGAFAGGKSSTPPASRYGGMKISTTYTTTRSWYGVVNSRLCTFGLFIIIVMLIIISGDVELNPGPVNCKTCPRCLTETVPIRLKTCNCGYVFHKKSHRQPPNHLSASQPVTYNVEVVTNSNAVPSDQVQSQLTGGDKSIVSHEEVVNDTNTVTDGDTVPVAQVQSQPVVSLKWLKYKAGINTKRREKYRRNSLPERNRAYQSYHKQPELHKGRKRVAYNFNPSPAKKRARYSYSLDPSIIRAHKREVYKSNPSPVRAHKREVYTSNPSPVRAHKREVYRSNPSPVKERVRKTYSLNAALIKRNKRELYKSNPSPIKERSRLAYHINPTLVKERSKGAYHKDREGMKYKRRQTYRMLRKSLLDRRSLQKLVACAVSKKYKKLRECLPDNFKKYASNVIRTVSRGKISASDVEVEHLVRTCIHFRDMNRKRFINAFKKLKLSVLATLSKVLDSSDDDAYEIIMGPGMHTASSESFFPTSTYHDVALDKDGKVDVTKFPTIDVGKKQTNWTCVPGLCKLDDKSKITKDVCEIYSSIGKCDPIDARHYIQHMDDCDQPSSHDPLLAGHSEQCHLDDNACKSKLLYLRRLAPHFPNVRQLVHMIYGVRRTHNQVCRIDQALQTGNVELLRQIAIEQKSTYQGSTEECISTIDESKVLETYMNAFVAYNDRCSECAEFPCMSCNKLCFKRECVLLERCRAPITGRAWDLLMEYLEGHPVPDDSLCTGYICKFCIEKFRNGTIPSRCMLNGLSFEPVPTEIVQLNQHERVLIQRAKAFQVITRMQTVAGKRLPPSHKVSKVKGSTFHLPLPLNETLKRLPSPEEALPLSGELYILLRSIPTEKKVIWQNLVDINKVYSALSKLKEINPLYAQINLPTSVSDLNLCDKITECVITASSADSDDEPAIDEEPEREPMVREIPESEEQELYHDYTIHALHAPRENEKAVHLYQLLRINESPIDVRCKQLDLLCFPDLFPHGCGGQRESREVPLGPADYIKALLKSRDPRFRRNIQFIFFHLHQAILRQISSGVYHKLKIVRATEKLTAARYLNMLENEELEGDLCSVFARLRNSEQYWMRPRNELNSMSFYYGPATWYLTLSPSEWNWEDLGQHLRRVNPDFADKSISELVAADPVATSRFIDNKLKAILDFITSDSEPIGKVTHYYYRREYQGRGLQHFHFQIWIQNAPIIGVSSNERIIEFVSKYCTCSMPDKNLSPILHYRVMNYQSHRCNSYCMRSKKTKLGVRKVCRFGFPRPVKDSFTLRTVVEAIAGRKALRANSRLYDLPRQHNERMINDYNPAILLAWQGNMDIQYIGEKSSVLNWYITKYTTKAERSHSTTAFGDLTSNKSLASKLWNIALRSLSNRECGALEAADTLLGIPLYGTDPSTVFRWVDINMIRSRRVKENHIIQGLPSDCEDILYPSLIDTYYPNRPAELESTNLYTFMSWYDVLNKQPSKAATYYPLLGRYLKKRNQPYLLNHYKYNPEQEPEKYFYSILLLFKPWRECDSLIGDKGSYTEAFHSCKDELMDGNNYHEQLVRLQEADTKVRELIGERRAEMEAEEDTDSKIPPAAGPLSYACNEVVHDAMDEFNEIFSKNSKTDIDLMISKLNTDQLEVFNKVTSAIQAQVNGTTDSNAVTVRLFVSGCGGTGKSFLIKTIREWVLSATDKGVAVVAPTGIAAVNINGMTIHRTLMLPVEHGKTPKYRPLSDDALKITRDVMRNVILVIIDEISMVSNVTLLYIHLRLTEIFQTEDVEDGWFGKRNMLFLGDLLQLPPVFEGPVYTPLTAKLTQKYTGCVGAVNLWRDLFSYLELTINMRQKDDKEFVELLSRICLGCIINEDIKLLNKRKIQLKGDTVSERLKEVAQKLSELPPDTVCLLPTRNMCDQLNKEMLCNLSGEEIRCIASDTVDCPINLRSKVSKMLIKYSDDSSNTAGLEKELVIKLGCKVMLRRNIDITLGLVNGAIGTIRSVKLSIDQASLVESMTVHFSDDRVHQLTRVKSKFQVLEKAYVIRQQFPITIAYSITIHKSQGLTLHNVVADIGNSIFTCGQSYVALSRVTNLTGLHLINFDPRSIKALNSAVTEYTYLRKTFTPRLPSLAVNKKKLLHVPDAQWCINKSTLLAQQNSSLHNVLTTLPNKGFLNDDGNGYANSILQCLLNSKVIRSQLVKESCDNIKQLVNLYESPAHTPIDSSSICKKLASMLADHNPVDFLTAFVRQYSGLRPLIEHCTRTETVCTKCTHAIITDEKEIIVNVSAHDLTKNVKINNLLQDVQNWHVVVCSKCNGPCRVRKIIVNAGELLVFKFDMLDPTGKVRRKININCVPTTSLKIDTSFYRVKTSIHYEQTKTAGISYASIVSVNGKWLHCLNKTLTFVQWPKGARDMFLLFLERTSVNSDSRKTSKLCGSKVINTFPSKSADSVKCRLDKRFDNNPLEVKTNTISTEDCVVTGFDMPLVRTEWPEYRYYPVDEEWQRNACNQLGLSFVRPFTCVPGGPDVVLTRPDDMSLKKIVGDGNCLFRSLCYIITGSQSQHFELRCAIVAHMLSIPNLMCGLGSDGHRNYLYGSYDSVEAYLARTKMADNRTWGTDTEMCVLAHLLNTVIYNFNSSGYWLPCLPHGIDRSIPYNVRCRSLYIYNHHANHFEVVTDIHR